METTPREPPSLRVSAQSQPSLHDRSPLEAPSTITLSSSAYRITWVTVASIYFVNGCVCSMYVVIYVVFMAYRDGYFIEYLTNIQVSDIPVIVAAYGLAATMFWTRLCQLLWRSLRRRSLTFTFPISRRTATARSTTRHSEPSSSESVWPTERRKTTWTHWSCRALRCLWRQLKKKWRFGWSLDGLISFDGPLLREVVEILLQTYQAHKASTLVLSEWVNTFFVICLVLNCWLSPLIHILTNVSQAVEGNVWRRWLLLWVDLLLDFVSALVIPVLILLNVLIRIVVAAPTANYVFDVPFDDVTLMDTILSAKQLVVLNWIDVAAKVIPIYSMFKNLDKIILLAHRVEQPTTHQGQDAGLGHAALKTDSSLGGERPGTRFSLFKTNRILPVSGIRVHGPQRHPRVRRYLPFLENWVHPAVHALFLLAGALIAIVYIVAFYLSSRATPTVRLGCKAAVRPWFETRFACSVMEINCYRRNISGSAMEIDAVAFEMPARIQTLHNLIGLELTNVSVVAWDETAALASSFHDSLHFLSIVRTNISEIPMGLRSPAFPKSLRDMHISVSNLLSVPDDLHHVWKRMMNVYFERCKLAYFPPTLAAMKVERLSLLGNDIGSIPEDLLRDNAFHVLSLARNPSLQQLPQSIGSLTGLWTLLLEDTNLTSLPESLIAHKTGTLIDVHMAGTPACQLALDREGGDFAKAEAAIAAGSAITVSCQRRPDEEIEGYALTKNLIDRVP